jgi:proton glutamate symport protein
MSGLHIDASVTAQLRASVADTILPTGDTSITTWFKSLIPTNPIKATAEGTMLSIIVFAAAFGFATLAAPEEPRSRVIAFTKTLSEIMMILV